MKINSKVTLRRVENAVKQSMRSLDSPGFCVACGAEAHGVEPDARRYVCVICGESSVYGAEELLIMMVA